MALKVRDGLVGKRFASLKSGDFRKLGECGTLKSAEKWSNAGWRSGIVRTATHKDFTDLDIKVRSMSCCVYFHFDQLYFVYCAFEYCVLVVFLQCIRQSQFLE